MKLVPSPASASKPLQNQTVVHFFFFSPSFRNSDKAFKLCRHGVPPDCLCLQGLTRSEPVLNPAPEQVEGSRAAKSTQPRGHQRWTLSVQVPDTPASRTR